MEERVTILAIEKYGGEAHDSHGTRSIGAGAGAGTGRKEPELQGTLKKVRTNSQAENYFLQGLGEREEKNGMGYCSNAGLGISAFIPNTPNLSPSL